jgi:hypothetical protein
MGTYIATLVPGLTRDRSKLRRLERSRQSKLGLPDFDQHLMTKSGKPDLVAGTSD